MSDPATPIRVLIVDDEPMVRAGLTTIVDTAVDMQVVGQLADGSQVLAAVEQTRPDVVLLDIRMPRQDGLVTTRQLREELGSSPAILILTTWDADEVALRAVRAGANGFLLKTDGGLDILRGIRAVATGAGALADSKVPAVLAAAARSESEERAEARRAVAALSPRERETIIALSGPGNLEEVASTLFVAKSTLKTHMESAQHKLGVTSRHELAVIAAKAGLL